MAGILDILDGLGYALDTPGALTRGLLAGRPGERVGGRELLEGWGVLGENQEGFDAGDVAGFGAELLLDPVNLLSGGTLAGLKVANRGIGAANDASRAMRAAGAMPEEIAKLTKLVDDSGAPLRTYHGTPHVFDEIDSAKFNPESRFGPGYYSADVPGVVTSEYVDKGSGALDSARQLAVDDLAFLNRRLPRLREAEAAGLPDDILERHGMTRAEKIAELEQRLAKASDPTGSGSRPNVRMQFIDSRNPLDIDAPVSVDDQLRLLPASSIGGRVSEIGPPGPGSWDEATWLDQIGVPDSVRRDFQQNFFNDTEQSRLVGLLDQTHSSTGVPASQLMDALQPRIGNPQSGAPGVRIPDALSRAQPMTGGDLYDELRRVFGDDRSQVNDWLRDKGVDAIVAEGGGMMPHREIVALDPSQVYSPYVAPALRPEHRLAEQLAALGLGANVGLQTAGGF